MAALWVPRQLRSGKEFSCHLMQLPAAANCEPIPTSAVLSPLLAAAVAAEPFDCDREDGKAGNVTQDAGASAAGAEASTSKYEAAKAERLVGAEARHAEEVPDERAPTPPHVDSATSPPAAKRQKLSHSHKKRRLKRQKAKKQPAAPRPDIMQRILQPEAAIAIPTLNAEDLPAAWGAYGAKNPGCSGAQKLPQVLKLLARGFRLIEWDGRGCRPILDNCGRVIAVLVGRPKGDSYAADVDAAYDAIVRAGANESFSADECDHRRGRYPAINAGIAYGPGQAEPAKLKVGTHGPMLQELLSNAAIQRLAAFASFAFSAWAPRTYAYYAEHLDAMYAQLPHLKEHRNFERSIFPSAAFNFGPNAWTREHRDVQNCPFGWCSIQALGHFNPKTGGHLVLEDLKLVVEFPPGALVLIPSATVMHSNIPVQPGESRASFTQYCSGGIFRWVDNGFRTETELKAKDWGEYERLMALKDTRWKMGLDLFSTIDELLSSSQ